MTTLPSSPSFAVSLYQATRSAVVGSWRPPLTISRVSVVASMPTDSIRSEADFDQLRKGAIRRLSKTAIHVLGSSKSSSVFGLTGPFRPPGDVVAPGAAPVFGNLPGFFGVVLTPQL